MVLSTKNLIGFKLETTNGNIGRLQDIYFDDRNWKLKYLTVETGTWFIGNQVAINCKNIESINLENSTIKINLSNEEVKNSETTQEHKPVYLQMKDQSAENNSWLSFGGAGMGYPTSGMVKAITETKERQEQKYNRHLRSCEHIACYGLHDASGLKAEIKDLFLSTADWKIKYLSYQIIDEMSVIKYSINPFDIYQIDFENKALFTNRLDIGEEDFKLGEAAILK